MKCKKKIKTKIYKIRCKQKKEKNQNKIKNIKYY